ncbi:MAG TPA: glycosyltransferase family 39 protein [Planctomycetota bacterium]|nr:glycosyltransferase family 39 protein [Planctomycetota bacterium]
MAEPAAGATAPIGSRLRLAGEASLVATLLAVAYAPSLALHFLADDTDWLSVAMYGPQEIPELNRYFRPLAMQLFRGAYDLFGLDPLPYRVVILLLHGTCAFFAGRLAARVLNRPSAGWIAAAVFAMAPAGSEVVRSISSFVYPCVAALVLGGLLLYARAIEKGRVLPWLGAVACFGLAAPLREHFVVALPIALLLEVAYAGRGALRRRGPWLRLAPLVVVGVVYLAFRQNLTRLPLVPKETGYELDPAMGARLVVTLQRLVLPTIPLPISAHALVHRVIGAALLFAALVLALRSPREDRRRALVLIAAVLISLLPFLPVVGDHVRQRFAYLATAFAAGLVAFAISRGAERISPRLVLPSVLAILAGLLLELQGDYAHYELSSRESKARFEIYPQAAEAVTYLDGIAVFAGDLEPNLQAARSTFRIVAPGIVRRQVVEIAKAEDLGREIVRLRAASQATGRLLFFTRYPREYRLESPMDAPRAVERVYEQAGGGGSILVLLPRAPEN